MDKVERGAQARHILDHPVFNELLSELEASYVDVWKTADTVEAREDAHRYVVLLATLKTDLEQIAHSGTLERMRREELSGRSIAHLTPLRRA